tara:strand:- start:2184 stop:2405 length:222 start_codon:yes stop_codon:yes gene_type:complete
MKKFKEFRKIDEAPLVMSDKDILQTIFNDIEKKIMKNFERNLPLVKSLAKEVGYGVTKSGQSKGRTFRYELKK